MTTTIKATFTKRDDYINCAGQNHTDQAQKARCDLCKYPVLLVKKDGKISKVLADHDTWGMSLGFWCWSKDVHVCNENSVQHHKFWDAYDEANGKIIKGTDVVVVRGRKTPIGTEGVVFWLGEDNYGKVKAGIKDAEGNTIWIALSNLVAKWSNEYQSEVN